MVKSVEPRRVRITEDEVAVGQQVDETDAGRVEVDGRGHGG